MECTNRILARRFRILKIVALICARNEEKYLGGTLDFLKNYQTLPVSEIIVVNDGSEDRTFEIAKEFCSLVINRKPHEESFIGTPKMAIVWNIGLDYISSLDSDYIILLGADKISYDPSPTATSRAFSTPAPAFTKFVPSNLSHHQISLSLEHFKIA